MMKFIRLALLGAALTYALQLPAQDNPVVLDVPVDWRDSTEFSLEEQVAALIKTVFGSGHPMAEIRERYGLLYHAAREGNWSYARYQLRQIIKLLTGAAWRRPGRAETIEIFLNDPAIPALFDAIDQAEQRTGRRGHPFAPFQQAFAAFADACDTCHYNNRDEDDVRLARYLPLTRHPRKPYDIIGSRARSKGDELDHFDDRQE